MLVFIAPSVQRCDCQGAFLLVKDWGWVEEQRRKSRNKGVDMKPRAGSICADGGGQKRRSGVTVLFQRRPYPPTMLARDAIWLGPAGRQNHRCATCSPTDSPCNRSHASLFLFMQDPFTKRSLSSQWTLPHRNRTLSWLLLAIQYPVIIIITLITKNAFTIRMNFLFFHVSRTPILHICGFPR